MQTYETTFIVNPQAEDAAIDGQVSAVVDLIKSNGGEIRREDRIGTRRLAYDIGGLTQGYYACIIFDAPSTVLPILERHYHLEEPYVRYLTIRFDGDPEALLASPEAARPASVPTAAPPAPPPADQVPKPSEESKPTTTSPAVEETPAMSDIETAPSEAAGTDEQAAEVESTGTDTEPTESPEPPEMDDEL